MTVGPATKEYLADGKEHQRSLVASVGLTALLGGMCPLKLCDTHLARGKRCGQLRARDAGLAHAPPCWRADASWTMLPPLRAQVAETADARLHDYARRGSSL